MGIRRDARKLSIRVLYIMDMLEMNVDEAWEMVSKEDYPEKAVKFAKRLVNGTVKNLDFINNKILKYARNWELDRIAYVDRAILRLGIYEIYFEDTIPKNASINEAVELAKYFSTSKSHKFVNGILDTAGKEAVKS